MRQLLLVISFGFVLFNAGAQLVPVYSTGFDNTSQQAGWTQFRKGIVSQFEEWDFDNGAAFSGPLSLVHYYQVGGSEVMDDWFVSPAFTIPGGGALDSLRYYFSGFGVPQAGDTVFIYLLNGNPDPDLATSSQILMEFSGANYQNDNTWRQLGQTLLPAQSGNSYIAFRYRTVNNWLDVRFDNLSISKMSAADVDEKKVVVLTLSPNPLNGNQLQVQYDEALFEMPVIEIYNTAGQLVYTQQVTVMQPFELAVAPGFYTCLLKSSATGLSAQSRLVVQ